MIKLAMDTGGPATTRQTGLGSDPRSPKSPLQVTEFVGVFSTDRVAASVPHQGSSEIAFWADRVASHRLVRLATCLHAFEQNRWRRLPRLAMIGLPQLAHVRRLP